MEKKQIGKNTILGKHHLMISVSSLKTAVTQLFHYDDIREIRVEVETFEVQLLMNYDSNYHQVFKIEPKDNTQEELEKARNLILKFYNDLVTASMKFTKEELENIKNQRESIAKKLKEEAEAKNTKVN